MEHQSIEYPIYVYEVNNKVAGYIYFTGYRPGRRAMRHTAEISYYIHNDYQRQGIGTKLMEFAILLEWNVPSIKLLEKFGFKE